jgi:hypothetical protein
MGASLWVFFASQSPMMDRARGPAKLDVSFLIAEDDGNQS